MYNQTDERIFFSANKDEQKELLVNRIKDNNIKTPILFLKKEVILWTQSNFNIIIENKNINNNLYQLALNFNQGLVYIIFILFIISLYPKNKIKLNKIVLLIQLILFVYLGVYLLIEVSPRYGYILHMLIFLLVPLGLERLEEIIKKYKK